MLQALVDGKWADQFAFDLSPQEWIDFAPANYLSSTHPDTIFVQKLLLILHDPKGREILFGDMLETVTERRVEKQTIRPEDKESILRSRFRLKSGI